jgi:hypothetical protein
MQKKYTAPPRDTFSQYVLQNDATNRSNDTKSVIVFRSGRLRSRVSPKTHKQSGRQQNIRIDIAFNKVVMLVAVAIISPHRIEALPINIHAPQILHDK